MLSRRIRKEIQRLERLGVCVSPEHAYRLLGKRNRRKVQERDEEDD